MAAKKLEVVGIDKGNNKIKGCWSGRAFEFPHALHKIVDYDESQAISNPNIFVVNGTPYAIGRQAERMSVGKLTGNARYSKEYSGVLDAIMLYKLFDESRDDLYVLGSYPPRDKNFRDDICAATKGRWEVTCMGARKKFRVVEAKAMSEPSAAFRHATYAWDGIHKHGPKVFQTGLCLGIDLGGFTLDLMIFEGGKPDHFSAGSFSVGVMDIMDDLERQLRRDFKKEMQGYNDYPRAFLEEALQTYEYPRKGAKNLPCKNQVDAAFTSTLNQMSTLVQERYGGWNDYDALILMNGGSAAIEARFREAVSHTSIHVSEMERGVMQYSTAYGLMKAGKALQAKGMI